MNKSLSLLAREFESSSTRTPQYLEFHRTFKREFTKALSDIGCSKVEISKPNHFDVSGFFTADNNQIYYFSISDLRWSKDNLLIRTAKHYKDYRGGGNNFIHIDGNMINKIDRLVNKQN